MSLAAENPENISFEGPKNLSTHVDPTEYLEQIADLNEEVQALRRELMLEEQNYAKLQQDLVASQKTVFKM